MTMSLPVTLPAPATTGKAASAAPGKGTAAAPGQTKEGAATDAAGVADMFAALVATLTAQMQPAATDASAPPAGGTAGGAQQVPVAPATVGMTIEGPVADPAALLAAMADGMEGAGTAADAKAATPAVPADPGVAPATPAVPASAEGDTLPATPATPATPASDVDAEGPATPATPAQPHAPTRAEALAAAVLAPPATDKPDVDRGVAAVPATPATPASASVDRAAAATPARPATPAADPHVQVARVVRPLRLGNDGAYELALDLTPAELGRVRIDVELRGATIHLNLRADNPATRDLLQASMDQLRSELEAAGLQAGNLDVGGRGASDPRANDEQPPPAAGADGAADGLAAAPSEPTITAEDTASGVNVLA